MKIVRYERTLSIGIEMFGVSGIMVLAHAAKDDEDSMLVVCVAALGCSKRLRSENIMRL